MSCWCTCVRGYMCGVWVLLCLPRACVVPVHGCGVDCPAMIIIAVSLSFTMRPAAQLCCCSHSCATAAAAAAPLCVAHLCSTPVFHLLLYYWNCVAIGIASPLKIGTASLLPLECHMSVLLLVSSSSSSSSCCSLARSVCPSKTIIFGGLAAEQSYGTAAEKLLSTSGTSIVLVTHCCCRWLLRTHTALGSKQQCTGTFEATGLLSLRCGA